jgi:hypothetical protein
VAPLQPARSTPADVVPAAHEAVVSWVSYYVCDWCGRKSSRNIREDSFAAEGWVAYREFDSDGNRSAPIDLCSHCVERRRDAIAEAKASTPLAVRE